MLASAVRDGPAAAMLPAMKNPEIRRQILAEAQANPVLRVDQRPYDFERVFALGSPPDYEPPLERSVDYIARTSGRDVLATAYDLMLEDEGQALLLAPSPKPGADCICTPHTHHLYSLDALRHTQNDNTATLPCAARKGPLRPCSV